MKIAIDVSPLDSGHSVRGVGFYLLNLKNSLQKYFPENEYLFFKDESEIDGTFDIIHYPYFDPFSRSLKFNSDCKVVVTVHDLIPLIFKKEFPVGVKGNINWVIQKRNLRRVSRIITDSFSSKQDIEKLIDYPGNKIDVVHLAAGDQFNKIKKFNKKKLVEKYNLPSEFVLYVGDVTWNKNLPNLIKAVLKTEYKLVIVGKAFLNRDYDRNHPWNKSFYEAQVLAEGSDQVIPLGFVNDDDLVALYNAATCMILPSIYEGFGLPVVEAMKCGCPVITTKEGSLEEVADSAAEFVDPRSIESILKGITDVMENKSLRQAMSKKGLEWSENFNWKKVAQETIESYEKALSD